MLPQGRRPRWSPVKSGWAVRIRLAEERRPADCGRQCHPGGRGNNSRRFIGVSSTDVLCPRHAVYVDQFVPLFPFNLLNCALGLTGIPLPAHVLTSTICVLPGATPDTWLGYIDCSAVAGDAAERSEAALHRRGLADAGQTILGMDAPQALCVAGISSGAQATWNTSISLILTPIALPCVAGQPGFPGQAVKPASLAQQDAATECRREAAQSCPMKCHAGVSPGRETSMCLSIRRGRSLPPVLAPIREA
ncbi:MAG: hypothetical protein ACREE1_01135 [Stellaceae bacterium]